MASNWQTVAIPLVSGLDTSYDSYATPVAKLSKLVNGYFDKDGAIAKRPGYEKKTDLRAPTDTITEEQVTATKVLVTRKDEILRLGANYLDSYSDSAKVWSPVDVCRPMSIVETPVNVTTNEQTVADVATNFGVTVYAWEDNDFGLTISIYDERGKRLNYFKASGGVYPRVVACGDYIHVLWHDTTTTIFAITITAGTAATVSQADYYEFLTLVSANNWDVQTDPASSYFYVAYDHSSQADVYVSKFNPNGAIDSSTHTSTGNVYLKPSIAVNDTRWFCVWQHSSAGFRYFQGTTTGSLGNGTTAVTSLAFAHTPADIKNLTAGLDSNNVWRAFFTYDTTGTPWKNVIKMFAGDETGLTDSEDDWLFGAAIAAKPILTPDGETHLPVQADSGPLQMQNTYMLYQNSTRYVPGVYVLPPGESTVGSFYNRGKLVGTFSNGVAADFVANGYVPSTNRNGNEYTFAALVKAQVTAVNEDKYGGTSVRLVTIDYDHKPQHVAANDSTLIASGLTYEYDGANVVESNFVFWPELDVDLTSTALADHTAVTEGGGASSMGGGTYGYKFYYEWTNAYGQRQRSTAVPFSVALAGSFTVSIVVPNLRHTLKQQGVVDVSDVIIVGYRTVANGSLYYRMTSPDPTATGDNGYFINDPESHVQTITDVMVDADLIYNEIDPLTGGVLDHTLPRSGQWVAGTQQRVFMAGGTIPESTVYYSKLRQAEDPTEFFEGLSIQIDKKGGVITALAVLNDNLVVFKNNHIFMVGGTGPDNNGFGDFNKPFEVTTTVGCNNAHSVALIPQGLIFQSDKGFFLLQKNYTVAHIGAPVEDYNAQVHTATVIPDDSLVVFLAESGDTLAYNFEKNQWSTYDNHLGVSSALVGDDYFYANTKGAVLLRTPNEYADDGASYALKLKTAPLRFQGLQEYWRARRLSIAGRYHSDHELNVRVWYNREQFLSDDKTYDISDFIAGETWGYSSGDGSKWEGFPTAGAGETDTDGDSFSDTVETDLGYDPNDAANYPPLAWEDNIWGSDNVWGGEDKEYQVQHRFGRQKVQTVTVEISEKRPTTQGFSINELALEYAMKSGLGRIGKTRKK